MKTVDLEALPANGAIGASTEDDGTPVPADTPASDNNNDNDDEYDVDDVQLIEDWSEVVSAVTDATKEAVRRSPPFNPRKPSLFQSYWSEVFNDLSARVATNSSIPEFLTSPPTKIFRINLFDNPSPMCCPCSLPDVETNIIVRNPNGVNKTDFVQALAEYMYGEDLPKIYRESSDRFEGESEHMAALVYESDWMSGGRDRTAGEERVRKFVYDHYEDEVRTPKIWLYCCRSKDFHKLRADERGNLSLRPKPKVKESTSKPAKVKSSSK
jgi:hypothetical protein